MTAGTAGFATAGNGNVSAGDVGVRNLLSSLRALHVLSMVMTESRGEDEILEMAASAVPSLGQCWVEAVALEGEWRRAGTARSSWKPRELKRLADGLGKGGGKLEVPGCPWGWAFSVGSRGGPEGYLVVCADVEPPEHEQSLLRALVQLTRVALANARLHARERGSSAELRTALDALRRSMEIHQRLTRVAAAGEGPEGIARAVHDLTGLPVGIEDRAGNVAAWAGPDRPDPYPRTPPGAREQLLRRALAVAPGPLREEGRLLVVTQPPEELGYVLALIDPAETAGNSEAMALEHAATVLAMEVSRFRSLAETELRLGRDLVEELLAGSDPEEAHKRAAALGYDLALAQRVVIVEGQDRTGDDEHFFNAVRRSARDVGIGSLLVVRAGTVVVLADDSGAWAELRAAVLSELGVGTCRVGVGGRCCSPEDFPRSYREAQLALRTQKAARGNDQVTTFDDLGVYRVLSEVEDPGTIERYVQQWLGVLIDHDERKHSDLVATLAAYVDSGGSYDAAAKALSVHRSTLRYRLDRIREITGHDLADPETRFNLQLAGRSWNTLRALRP